MGVTTRNIFSGPATVHVGIEGVTEPADALAAMPAGWRDIGGTTGGARLSVNLEYFDLQVDQVPESVGKQITNRTSTVATTMAEPTLANWAAAINELAAAVVTAGDTDTLEPSELVPGADPNYVAVCLTGPGPDGKRRRFILRRALSTESIESQHSKTEQTGIPVTWTGHYVSPSVRPFVMMDTAPAA